MRKQMEGDNAERRAKAREARERGKSPSAERVTTGSSKQRKHLDHGEDHVTKVTTARATKQPLAEGKREPRPHPRQGRAG
jgi:hypothetical protein